ncbi:hypothetical protein [Psychromonas sp.]|uniref:hypothetical protein n=1 Tax=Psychromonas sp. TaxID=1884585 RepID=UPI0039E62CC3
MTRELFCKFGNLCPDYIFKLTLNRSLLMDLQSQGSWLLESGLVATDKLPNYRLLLDARAL